MPHYQFTVDAPEGWTQEQLRDAVQEKMPEDPSVRIRYLQDGITRRMWVRLTPLALGGDVHSSVEKTRTALRTIQGLSIVKEGWNR